MKNNNKKNILICLYWVWFFIIFYFVFLKENINIWKNFWDFTHNIHNICYNKYHNSIIASYSSYQNCFNAKWKISKETKSYFEICNKYLENELKCERIKVKNKNCENIAYNLIKEDIKKIDKYKHYSICGVGEKMIPVSINSLTPCFDVIDIYCKKSKLWKKECWNDFVKKDLYISDIK